MIELGGVTVADSWHGYRVLETSHPPGYYLPRDDFLPGVLQPAGGSSYCEWKGTAAYLDVIGGELRAARAAWFYPQPTSAFRVLRDHVAVYPGAMQRVTVDGELVRAQDGGFYGGWITSRVVGPFKGAPDTWGW